MALARFSVRPGDEENPDWEEKTRLNGRVFRKSAVTPNGELMNIKGLLFVPLATAMLWTLIGSAMYIIWQAYRLLSAVTGTAA